MSNTLYTAVMTPVIFRSYLRTLHAAHSGSAHCSHCCLFRVLRWINVNDKEDRIWITLLDTIRSHGKINCRILDLYEV